MHRADTLFIALLIAAAAFCSYNHNAFKVSSDTSFREHQLDSEQLVLDGILRGGDGWGVTPGRYTRPRFEHQHLRSHQLYARGNREGEFEPYKSQFGLQVHLFRFLAQTFSGEVSFLQSVCALMMSLVVALFFVAVNREFGRGAALSFCLPLIFSPWVVNFARNLYWVEATWFFPTAITFLLGRGAFHSARRLLLMGCLLFAALLTKFLCGYEYLTTIAVSALVPLVYYGIQYRAGTRRLLAQAALYGTIVSLAFLAAATLHAGKLGGGAASSLEQIAVLAKKRLSAQKPEALAEEACRNAVDPKGCAEGYLSAYGPSLTSSALQVTAKYFDVPHFLPWGDRFVLTPAEVAAVEAVTEQRSFASALHAVAGITLPHLLYLAYKAAGYLAFPLLALLASLAAWQRRDSLSAALLVSFLAPLSWFVLAKGHSYIHYHINYVLWYLLFVPCAMLLFFLKRPLSQGGQLSAVIRRRLVPSETGASEVI